MKKGSLNFEVVVDTKSINEAAKNLAAAYRDLLNSKLTIKTKKPNLKARIKAFWDKHDIKIAIGMSIFSALFSIFSILYSLLSK